MFCFIGALKCVFIIIIFTISLDYITLSIQSAALRMCGKEIWKAESIWSKIAKIIPQKTEISLSYKLHISSHNTYHHFKGRNWKIKCHLEIIISSFETHLVYKSNPAALLPSSQPQRFHTSLFMGSHLCRFIYQQHFISIRR